MDNYFIEKNDKQQFDFDLAPELDLCNKIKSKMNRIVSYLATKY